MKRYQYLPIIVAAFVLLLNAEAWAQGRGQCAACGPVYDTSTVETVEGVVVEVEYVAEVRGRGTGPGVHFTLKQGDAMLPIHLGPHWYLSEQEKPFEKGDAVTVVGSRVTMDGEEVLIAKTVTRGDATLVLRDDEGFPAWRGWRQGQGRRAMGRGMNRGAGAGGGCRCCGSS